MLGPEIPDLNSSSHLDRQTCLVHRTRSDVHGLSGLRLSVNFLTYGHTSTCLSGMAFEIQLDEADTSEHSSGDE